MFITSPLLAVECRAEGTNAPGDAESFQVLKRVTTHLPSITVSWAGALRETEALLVAKRARSFVSWTWIPGKCYVRYHRITDESRRY